VRTSRGIAASVWIVRSGTWNPDTHANLYDEASVRHLNHHQRLAKSEASFDARTMTNGLRSRKADKDLAQGFNPGSGVFNAICPVGAPGTPFEGWSWKHAQSRGKQTWRPFRACRGNCSNPGLKPWAQSCFPFAENKARRQTPNANSSDVRHSFSEGGSSRSFRRRGEVGTPNATLRPQNPLSP